MRRTELPTLDQPGRLRYESGTFAWALGVIISCVAGHYAQMDLLFSGIIVSILGGQLALWGVMVGFDPISRALNKTRRSEELPTAMK